MMNSKNEMRQQRSIAEIVDEILPTSQRERREQWCRLFRFQEWVVDRGHYEVLYPTVTAAKSVVVPAATIYDVQSKRHWITHTHHRDHNGHVRTQTHHHYRISGRKIHTTAVAVSVHFLKNGRALQVGQRNCFFLSHRRGPLSAAHALSRVVNQKAKRAHEFQIMVNHDMLRDMLQCLQSINQQGGYATCTIAKAGPWYMMRNITILGWGNPPTPDTVREYVSNSYESGKTLPVGFGSSMVEILANRRIPIQTCVTKTVPRPGHLVQRHSPGVLLVPCHKTGWALNMDTVDIDRVDEYVQTVIQRPLRGKYYDIAYRSSKSNCAEIVGANAATPCGEERRAAMQNVALVREIASPLAMLGAQVTCPDGHEYVRVKRAFRFNLNQYLKDTKGTFVPYYEPVEGRIKHNAGWRGKYTIYRMRLMVLIDGARYWLDSLLPTNQIPNHHTVRPRYLQIEDRLPETECTVVES